VRNADLIVVVVDGRIIERGTHDELMALGREYRKLYELQFGESVASEPTSPVGAVGS
jgi:ABC-type multidrug transport system fused ATPase/permease subunit